MAGMLGTSENNQIIKNYFHLALDARQNDNYVQCETYCDRILSVDYNVPGAWMLKASATGWQSSVTFPRDKEMFNYYEKALSLADDVETGTKIMEIAGTDAYAIGMALMKLACDRFVKWPDADEALLVKNMQVKTLEIDTAISQLKLNHIAYSVTAEIKQCHKPAATFAYNAAQEVVKSTRREFLNSNGGFPDDYDFRRMLDRMEHADFVYEVAGGLDPDMVDSYEKRIELHNFCIGSFSCTRQYSNGNYYWVKNLSLTAEAIGYRNTIIAKMRNNISDAEKRKKEKEEKERKARIEAYWKEHEEEKKKLEAEKDELKKKEKELKDALDAVEQDSDILDRKKQIEFLKDSRGKLGLFAIKEKSRMDKIIREREEDLHNTGESMKTPIREELQKTESRIKWITNELTRDRK